MFVVRPRWTCLRRFVQALSSRWPREGARGFPWRQCLSRQYSHRHQSAARKAPSRIRESPTRSPAYRMKRVDIQKVFLPLMQVAEGDRVTAGAVVA